MSAAVLRQAATLMRERAEAAGPSPWSVEEEHGRDFTDEGWSHLSVNDSDGKSVAWYCDEQEGIDSHEHIRSWHPAVALAVADWLDNQANLDEEARAVGGRGLTDIADSVNVARTYLGTDA